MTIVKLVLAGASASRFYSPTQESDVFREEVRFHRAPRLAKASASERNHGSSYSGVLALAAQQFSGTSTFRAGAPKGPRCQNMRRWQVCALLPFPARPLFAHDLRAQFQGHLRRAWRRVAAPLSIPGFPAPMLRLMCTQPAAESLNPTPLKRSSEEKVKEKEQLTLHESSEWEGGEAAGSCVANSVTLRPLARSLHFASSHVWLC